MAYYAFLDENNIVTDVISGIDEDDLSTLPSEFNSWEEFYGDFRGQTCKRTSYNTIGNTHRDGGTAFRGNYAGIGYIYDEANDVFYPPQIYTSWTLDTNTWLWKAPIDLPDDPDNEYFWNESTQNWDIQDNIVTD
jgi:hypothetical protein